MSKTLFALIGAVSVIGAARRTSGSADRDEHSKRRRIAKQLAVGQVTPDALSARMAEPRGRHPGTQISPDEIERISQELVSTGEFYSVDGRFAKRGPAYFAFKRILSEQEPELAVRSVDLILSMLPGFTELAPGMWATKKQIVDVANQTGLPGQSLEPWVKMMLKALDDRRLTQETIDSDVAFNIDEASRRWAPIRFSPFIVRSVEMVMRENAQDHDALVEGLKELTGRGNRSLSYVFDWALAQNANINDMSADDAWDAATAWHEGVEMQRNRAAIEAKRAGGRWFDCPDGVHPIQGEVVVSFPNGFTIQRMRTLKELQYEANLSMGHGCLKHCVGEYSTYFNGVKSGDMEILSLRDAKNRSHVTIAIDLSDGIPYRVNQLRGFNNRHAGASGGGGARTILGGRALDPQFGDADSYLDAEAIMITAFLKGLGLTPSTSDPETADIAGRIKEINGRSGSQNRRRR